MQDVALNFGNLQDAQMRGAVILQILKNAIVAAGGSVLASITWEAIEKVVIVALERVSERGFKVRKLSLVPARPSS